jgi:hypothetical protein
MRSLTVARVEHLVSWRYIHRHLEITLEAKDLAAHLHLASINLYGHALA